MFWRRCPRCRGTVRNQFTWNIRNTGVPRRVITMTDKWFRELTKLTKLALFESHLNNVFYTAIETWPFRVESPKMEITHGSFGCTETIPLCGTSRHCFNFLQRFARPRKMAGNLERKCIPVLRFRLSTKPPWRVHNKVDNVRWKLTKYQPVSLKKNIIKAWAGRISVLSSMTDFSLESQWLCSFNSFIVN